MPLNSFPLNGRQVNNNSQAYLCKMNLGDLIPTGIKEEESKQTTSQLSPNPTSGEVVFESVQIGNLELYDLKGQLLKRVHITQAKQAFQIPELGSGVYLYRFLKENGVEYGKIVKQ